MLRRHRNSSLFSNHYLDGILLGENEWKIDIEPVFKEIKTLYDSNKSELPALNESQLLSEICLVEEAFTVAEAYQLSEFIHELKDGFRSNYLKFVVTGTIDRYVPLWGGEYTKYLKTDYLIACCSA